MRHRSSSPGDALVDVVLAEDVRTRAADPFPSPGPAPRGRGRRVRTTRLLGYASALAVVAAIAVLGAVESRHEGRRLAALGQVPGIAAPLDRPLEEAWRLAGVLAGDLGDRVLVNDPRARATRAVDAATGRVLWTRQAPDGGVGESCRTDPLDPSPPTVACLSPTGSDTTATSVGAVLAMVDVSTGETTAWQRLYRPVLDLGVVEGDVVVLTAEADGRVGGLRWDPDRDAVLWRAATRLEARLGARFATDWSARVLTVRGEVTSWLDLRSGREVPPEFVDDLRWLDVRRHDLAGGRALEWRVASGAGTVPVGARVLGRDGELVRTVLGRPWLPAVDDGSAGDVLLVVTHDPDPTLRALLLESGDPLWSRPVNADARPVFRVGRVVVAVEGGAVVARDLGSGQVRWTHEVVRGFTPVTDGSHVLLRYAAGGRATLGAHRLDDGSAVWTQGLPGGAREVLTVSGGGVVAVGAGWVAGLG